MCFSYTEIYKHSILDVDKIVDVDFIGLLWKFTLSSQFTISSCMFTRLHRASICEGLHIFLL